MEWKMKTWKGLFAVVALFAALAVSVDSQAESSSSFVGVGVSVGGIGVGVQVANSSYYPSYGYGYPAYGYGYPAYGYPASGAHGYSYGYGYSPYGGYGYSTGYGYGYGGYGYGYGYGYGGYGYGYPYNPYARPVYTPCASPVPGYNAYCPTYPGRTYSSFAFALNAGSFGVGVRSVSF